MSTNKMMEVEDLIEWLLTVQLVVQQVDPASAPFRWGVFDLLEAELAGVLAILQNAAGSMQGQPSSKEPHLMLLA